MVDFKKLRESKHLQVTINPIEIFRRMPKPPGINDLYTSQAQVLEQWFECREKQDIVIKLHTGGGKTLVGLLIAQSILNEIKEPVIYLCPNNQLVDQTLTKAQEYGISAVPYIVGQGLDDNFLTAKSILVCNYHTVFNGMSKFGIRGGSKEVIHAGAIILDDAHVSFPIIREAFTLNVDRSSDEEGYNTLTNMFRSDFKEIGKMGTFDDVVSGEDFGILEVPFWSFKSKSDEVREYLRLNKKDEYVFVWPLIRDSFDYCHALISKDRFVITPIFPLVDLFPTFYDCKKRIFMSATIADDSAIIRSFDADFENVKNPLSSNSLAGVSERMILVPELMKFENVDILELTKKILKLITDKRKKGSAVLVSSDLQARNWTDVAGYPNTSNKVNEYVQQLQNGESCGPFVFANRYDGIDLPDDACRLLVLSGLPKGTSEYDLYLANTFMNATSLNNSTAQRIEQGIGRGARGPGDYCVVIITGKDAVSWISLTSNVKYLTSSTRAQLEMGKEISEDISEPKVLWETILRCLDRDKEWTEYHAETLAEYDLTNDLNLEALKLADIERKAFKLLRFGSYEKSISIVDKFCAESKTLDNCSKGWLYQFISRVAYYHENQELYQKFQKHAYSYNRNLFRPLTEIKYEPMTIPGKQAEAIILKLADYSRRKGYLAKFDELVSHLVPEASANQFEQSLADLGTILGFKTERPDSLYSKGPDILWLLDDKNGLVIEAKSRKKEKNPLNKDNHGQLLEAFEWFKLEYPSCKGVKVSVHPNSHATKSTTTAETKVLTYAKLNSMVTEIREFLVELCESAVSNSQLIIKCEKLLEKSNLKPEKIVECFFDDFVEI